MIYFLQISNITAFQLVLFNVFMKWKHLKCALYRLFSKLTRKQPFTQKLWILNMGLLRKLERKALERLKTFTKLYEVYIYVCVCVCTHFIYIFILHKCIFFLAYVFVTKLYTTSLCKQRAKAVVSGPTQISGTPTLWRLPELVTSLVRKALPCHRQRSSSARGPQWNELVGFSSMLQGRGVRGIA